MEIVLTGNRIKAKEAEQIGLVSAVFPTDQVVNEAIKTAERICSHSPIVVQLAKEAVNAGNSNFSSDVSSAYFHSFRNNSRRRKSIRKTYFPYNLRSREFYELITLYILPDFYL